MAKRVASAAASQYVGEANVKLLRSTLAQTARLAKSASTIKLGRCASKFLKSYIDPFSVDQVCVPNPPSQPSMKLRLYVRGVCAIGTQGFGFIAVSPTLCKDRPVLYATQANYAQSATAAPVTDVTFLLQFSGGANYPGTVYLNSPFDFSQFQSSGVDSTQTSVEGKIVSASLRVQYAGTNLNQSGLMCSFGSTVGASVLGDSHTSGTGGNGYTMAQAMSFAYSDVEMNKKQMQLTIFGGDFKTDDFTDSSNNAVKNVFPYCEGNAYTDSSLVSTGAPTSCICFTGVAGQSMYYEYVQHVEFKGTAVSPSMLTATEGDWQGYTIVRDIVARSQILLAESNGKDLKRAVSEVMRKMGVSFGNQHLTR